MAREARKSVLRVASNYARLLLLVSLGIMLVPLILQGTTDAGFGLWGLLGATAGFGDMFKEIVQTSMNRELGAAYHSRDDARFRRVFNSALLVSLAATALGATIYVGIFAALPLFNIDESWLGAARLVLVFQGVSSCASIALAPLYNLYIVSERMTVYNALLVADRLGYFLAAVAWVMVLAPESPQLTLAGFATTGAVVSVLVTLTAASCMLVIDPRTRPDPRAVSRAEVRSIIVTGGWNGTMSAALNMHIRLSQLLVNLWFGLTGNAVFAAAVRLSSYVRMVTTGMTDGLDVIAARITTQKSDRSLAEMLPRITRIHALVALPAGMVIFLYAPAILRLWIGRHLGPDQLDAAVMTVRILAIGMTARGISDGWIRVLYGAGYIRRYAPLVIVGGLANPVLSYVLYRALPDRPADEGFLAAFQAPAIAFSLIFTVVHFGCIQAVVRRCLGVSPAVLTRQLVGPALTAVALVSIGIALQAWAAPDTVWTLAAHAAALAAAFPLLALALVADAGDRDTLRRVRAIAIRDRQ